MRILIIGISWPPETFLLRLLRGLRSSGFTFIINGSGKPKGVEAIQWPVKWVYSPPGSRFAVFLIWLVPAIICGLKQPRLAIGVFRTILKDSRRGKVKRLVKNLLVLKYPVDLVYFPWLLSVGDYSALMAAGVPGLVSCRGAQVSVAPFNPLRPGVRETLQEAFRLARRVHCVSHAIMKEAVTLGLRESKAKVIPPAVDVDLFKAAEAPMTNVGIFEIVTTGSLIWRKGHEFALTAVSLLMKWGIPVHFTIIGDGPERQRILYTVIDLGLSGRVQLTGSLPPEKVLSFLQKANVFFLSSLSEGISNALLEAMACGLPVVSTDCGGISEVVTHNVEGYLVPVQDPVAAANALSRMYSNKSSRENMGNAARHKVLKKHALNTQVARFGKLAESAAAPSL